MKNLVAYDYENQRWIEGSEAILLRRNQLLDELNLLESPRGDEYARFVGVDKATAIARIMKELT